MSRHSDMLMSKQQGVIKASGLLGRQHFQVAYVTNDLGRAIGVFAREYRAGEFYYIRNVPLPMGGQMDIALAWIGNLNIEIIEARGNRNSFYESCLPADEFAIAFHHLGFLIETDEEWRSLQEAIRDSSRKVVFAGSDPSGLDFVYLEAPELGHFHEFIRPHQAWIDLFAGLPRN